ncbi:MAG: phytoene desaturase family protein [Tenacibaculum sp.]
MVKQNNKIAIIGSGFSSLSAACYMAKYGYRVTVFEKNSNIGGRARLFLKDGFTFDMGPTWYWMPDVFEKFFADFGKKPSDYYKLNKLSPAYQVYFAKQDSLCIPNNFKDICRLFESQEKGSSKHLIHFINEAGKNYKIAVNNMVYKPGVSPFELITQKTIVRVGEFFSTVSKQVRKKIRNEKLIKILEFPVLFLGAKPNNTPAFYNFMNYADFVLGTWHPAGGMYKVINAMLSLAKSLGVEFKTEAKVTKIEVLKNKKISGLYVDKHFFASDLVLSGADYHHTEQLLDKKYRQYTENYWSKKIFAPSSLLFYVGFKKKLKNISHHTLFFDTDFDKHAKAIYDTPAWPEKPLFYASFPSVTDVSFAPKNQEAGTFLIPLAPGIKDTSKLRDKYFDIIINRLEYITNQKVKDSILFKKSYCVNNFIEDYNSYKGNAYGLANTLTQTAFLRPKLKSKKVSNLYFTGQLTVPGPGVPPSLISGKVASNLIIKTDK